MMFLYGSKNPSFIKILHEQRVRYRKTFVHLWQYLAELLLEWEMFQIQVAEKTRTHFSSSTALPENRDVYQTKWIKSGRAGRTTDIIRRMRIVCCITKNTNTHVTLLFSAGTMFARTRLSVRVYVHSPSSQIFPPSLLITCDVQMRKLSQYYRQRSRKISDLHVVKMRIFWNAMLCCWLNSCQRFDGKLCVHFQGQAIREGSHFLKC
jgi:hypothetical protein